MGLLVKRVEERSGNERFPEHAKDRLSHKMWVHRRRRIDRVWKEVAKRKQAETPGENFVTTRMNRSWPCHSRGGWNNSISEEFSGNVGVIEGQEWAEPGGGSSGDQCVQPPRWDCWRIPGTECTVPLAFSARTHTPPGSQV